MWLEIKDKLGNFENDDLLLLLEEMETVLGERSHPRSFEAFDVSPDDLENDSFLLAAINPLYTSFHKIAPFTLKQIGVYIRNNFNEFIELED